MTVTTVFATAPGGQGNISSSSATYATARTSGTLSALDRHWVGQDFDGTYFCFESFVIFDTSGVPDTDDISSVVLSLEGASDASTTDFIARVAASAYNGGAAVAGDWVSGATLASATVLATWNSSGYSTNYNAFTDTGAFPAAINKTGNTALIVYSAEHADNSAPTNTEAVLFTDADAAGTTADGKLDITHEAGGGGTVVQDIIGTGIIAFAR